jgi:hypothetical protein
MARLERGGAWDKPHPSNPRIDPLKYLSTPLRRHQATKVLTFERLEREDAHNVFYYTSHTIVILGAIAVAVVIVAAVIATAAAAAAAAAAAIIASL